MESTQPAHQWLRDTWLLKRKTFSKITTMSWTTPWTKGQLIGKQEDNPIPCSSKDSSRANRAVWTKNRPKKGLLGHPTQQWSSSIPIVHVARPWTISKCPWTSKTFLDQTDEYTTLREISSVVTVTKSVTIATNPSNKLPLAVTSSIAVEEVDSGPLGFHKSWGSYLDK